MSEEEINEKSEDKFRINLKQNVKGFVYWDITCRGNTKEEVEQRLNELIDIAKAKCNELNGGVV